MTDQTPIYSVWTLGWSNPRKPRPEGFPEIVLQLRVPIAKGAGAGSCPDEMDEAWEEMRPYGYAVFWHQDAPPARRLSLESKQRIRRRNLWKRLLKRYPLFVEAFYKERVESQPEHYGASTPGEFADLMFYRTTQGFLRMVKESSSSQ